MPILSGRVRVNSTAGAVLDLTDANNNSRSTRSQVKGMGVFTSVEGRDLVGSDLRTQGYMAVVKSSPTSVTPYFFKNTDVSGWGNADNWMSLALASGGLPQEGTTNELLAKKSDTDYDAEWVNTIVVEDAQLKKHASDPGVPTLTFSRKKINDTLADNDELGSLKSVGYDFVGNELKGASLRFVSDGSVFEGVGLGSRIEFFVTHPEGEEKALTIDADKKIIFAGNSSAPTAVLGGMYYNTTNNAYYLGV